MLSRTDHKAIGIFSALNGQHLGTIAVLAEESEREMEGICYAHVDAGGGRTTQLHLALLENDTAALDDLYVKGFTADPTDLV